MRRPSRFSEVGFESMKMGIFLLFRRTKRPDLHRTARQRFSPLSVGSSVGRIWSPLDTRRPLTDPSRFEIHQFATAGRAPDSTRFLVRKAHMRGKAIGSQAMAKPPNKRPGEVSVRGLQRLIGLKYEREPPARHAGQARRVSPDLARHGSGCPVLGTLVPSGIHRTCRIVAGLAVLSVLASKNGLRLARA